MERAERETYSTIMLMLGEEEDALLWLVSYRGLFQHNFCMLWHLPTVYIWNSIICETNEFLFLFINNSQWVGSCGWLQRTGYSKIKHPHPQNVHTYGWVCVYTANTKVIWFRGTDERDNDNIGWGEKNRIASVTLQQAQYISTFKV